MAVGRIGDDQHIYYTMFSGVGSLRESLLACIIAKTIGSSSTLSFTIYFLEERMTASERLKRIEGMRSKSKITLFLSFSWP